MLRIVKNSFHSTTKNKWQPINKNGQKTQIDISPQKSVQMQRNGFSIVLTTRDLQKKPPKGISSHSSVLPHHYQNKTKQKNRNIKK
jgi:hypothetical protein